MFLLSTGISSPLAAKAVCGPGVPGVRRSERSVWSRDLAAPAPCAAAEAGHSTQLHKQTCGLLREPQIAHSWSPQLSPDPAGSRRLAVGDLQWPLSALVPLVL